MASASCLLVDAGSNVLRITLAHNDVMNMAELRKTSEQYNILDRKRQRNVSVLMLVSRAII